LEPVLEQASILARYAERVAIVPKHPNLRNKMACLAAGLMLGYSVPTSYGKGDLGIDAFTRATHLLGGRPDRQRRLAQVAPVVSFDCNRFTLDAAFGDYFDGTRFRPHPRGGYKRCLADSLTNITRLWRDYRAPTSNI
jgi:hypothetical protein